jgi:predicted nuclease of predicted toxin-antitoxin system
MWLLDANMDVHLVEILKELGVLAETADGRGWKSLSNGDLVGTAVSAGFTCLLTRDRRFGESAARALRAFRGFAVVVITLPQVDSQQHQMQFLTAWRAKPIEPVAGTLVHWPRATIE